MTTIFSKVINQETVTISLIEGNIKASSIGGKQIELIGMCQYDKTSPDLSQRLITVLNHSQFELKDGTLQMTPQYNPGTAALPQYLKQILARLYLNDPTLTELDLSHNQIDASEATAIASSLNTNTTLNKLDLAANHIGDNGAAAIANSLNTNKSLNVLYLSFNQIRDRGATAIARSLNTNNTLNELHLQANRIGDNGAAAIAIALNTNKTLTTLNLSGSNIGDDGAVAIASALNANSTLNILKLSRNQIGDNGATAIAIALNNTNNTLNNLDLWHNRIRDRGAAAIAIALNTNKTLTTLNLWDNRIGNGGAATIAIALNTNKTLTTLNLSENRIGDAQKLSLKQLAGRKNADYKDAVITAQKETAWLAFSIRFQQPRISEAMQKPDKFPTDDESLKYRDVLQDIPEDLISMMQKAVYKNHLSMYPVLKKELEKVQPRISLKAYTFTLNT